MRLPLVLGFSGNGIFSASNHVIFCWFVGSSLNEPCGSSSYICHTSAHPTALLVATDLQHILVFLLPGVSVCLFSV